MVMVSARPFLFEQYADDHQSLFLSDVDGVVWASNTYWAVPVPDKDHPVARLLALYNLPLVPCVLRSRETLTLDTETDPERLSVMAGLVRSVPKGLVPLAQHSLHGQPLYGYDSENRLALYELPGGRFVALNDRYRQLVEESSHGEWHGGPDPTKPVYFRHEGRTTGLLMGVRCRITQAEPTLTTTGA